MTPHPIQYDRGFRFERTGERLIVSAPAKVNLHLEVLGKRSDGYHELESLLVTVDLFDELAFRVLPASAAAAGRVTLECADASLAGDPENLVTRAARLMQEEAGCARDVEVTLTKRIPAGAGLGGGSSDAAATLLALERLWELGWSRERLAELGARLGSDVPFFLYGPAAICRGRGERVTSIPAPHALDLVIVHPHEHLSTAAVFGGMELPEVPQSVAEIESALTAGDVSGVAGRLFNRLQAVSERLSPAVAELARASPAWDCLGSIMTGSGSAFLAVCSSPTQASELAARLRREQRGAVFVVRACHDGDTPAEP